MPRRAPSPGFSATARASAARACHPAKAHSVLPSYDADDDEFLRAVAAYKARTGRQFPSLTELLAVLKGLGYSKP